MDAEPFSHADTNLHSTRAVAKRLGITQRRVVQKIMGKVLQAHLDGHIYKIEGREIARYIQTLALRGRGT